MSTPQYYTAKEKYENKTFRIRGELITVAKYVNIKNTIIQYEDKHLNFIEGCRLNEGGIKNIMKPSVGKKGYIGVGQYKPKDEEGNDIKSYEVWSSMIRRCYTSLRDRRKCMTVCDEWLNYQAFADWYELNYYEIDNEDIVLTNKIYSNREFEYAPDTTLFVPRYINTFLIQQNKIGAQDLPKGIYYDKRYTVNPYRVGFKKYEEPHTTYYGNYPTLEEAYKVLKEEKENYIHELAERLIEQVPYKVYLALKNYKIEENYYL